MSVVEQSINTNKLYKGKVVIYKHEGKNVAVVKIRNVVSYENETSVIVSVLEVRQGRFPKQTFRILVTRTNALHHEFFEIVGY